MTLAIYILQIVAFLDLFAVGLILPLVPIHARNLGASHLFVGLMGSVYAGFQLGSGPLIGSVSDLKGRKNVLIITLMLCSVAYILTGLSHSLYVILCMRAILGLFKQTQTLTKALVSDYERNRHVQSAIYGRMAAISGVGITTGPVLGGHLIEYYHDHGFKIIAVIVGICFLINAGLVYLLPKIKHERKKPRVVNKHPGNYMAVAYSSVQQSALELYKINWKRYWDVFLLKGLIGFAMGVYYSNYSTYLRLIYHLTPKYIGYVISFQGIVGSIFSYFIGYVNLLYTNDVEFTKRSFHVFLLLTVSLCGMIFSTNIYVYVFWLAPLAVGNAVGRLVTLEMVLKRSDANHRGMMIGASSSVRSLSGVVAPMVAGYLGEYYGVPYVIYASVISTSIGAVLSCKAMFNVNT